MKKWSLLLCLLMVFCLLLPTAVMAEGALEDDLYAFQLSVEGTVFTLPAAYSELEAAGWKLKKAEDGEQELRSSSYDYVTMVNGPLDDQIEMMVYFVNLDINTRLITDCPVGGLKVELPYSKTKRQPVVLAAKGIEMGKSNREDIEAAFGTPTRDYKSDSSDYQTMTYTMASYQEVVFRVQEGVLDNVEMRNFVATEDTKGEVSQDVPAEVTNYEAPTELGDDLTSKIVEFAGDLYRMPAPISAFEANGWRVMEYRDEYVASQDVAVSGVSLMRDNKTARFSLYNPTNQAILPENALVSSLPPLGTDGSLALVLPAGITKGSTSEEVFTAYDGVIQVLTEREEYNTYYYSVRGSQSVYISIDNETKLVTDITMDAK